MIEGRKIFISGNRGITHVVVYLGVIKHVHDERTSRIGRLDGGGFPQINGIACGWVVCVRVGTIVDSSTRCCNYGTTDHISLIQYLNLYGNSFCNEFALYKDIGILRTMCEAIVLSAEITTDSKLAIAVD